MNFWTHFLTPKRQTLSRTRFGSSQRTQGLNDHLAAHEREDDQGYDTRVGIDDPSDERAAEKPGYGHAHLEQGKGDGHADFGPGHIMQRNPLRLGWVAKPAHGLVEVVGDLERVVEAGEYADDKAIEAITGM